MNKDVKEKYEVIIGLEIHVQLKTKSRMFGAAPNDTWGAKPNSKVGIVDLGLPGALPVPNKTAIEWTQRFGKALNCSLRKFSKFDRKNYFYPDLPKGYQISQYDQPLCENGYLDIKLENGEKKKIRITRIHLEEDTGKSSHKNGKTYLDFNKSGTPLMELVTEPDFRSADETSTFAKMIQEAARRLDISNVDMEKGNMRLEANISVRKKGETKLPDYRVEVKNINSFRFMRNAINYEIDRQITALEKGETLYQETRGWDEVHGKTFLQRSKEDAQDYRYFPEPDIPPLVFDEDYFDRVLANLPKMPWELEDELLQQGVRADYASLIAYSEKKLKIYEEIKSSNDIAAEELAQLVANSKTKDEVLDKLKKKSQSSAKGSSLPDDELKGIVVNVINENPKAIEDYKKGKENAIKFLVGQVMKVSKGQADPKKTQELILSSLT